MTTYGSGIYSAGTYGTPPAPPPPVTFGPSGRWILDEDEALKDKMSGFSVSNYADNRQIPVEVFFRFPDPEERTRTFPHFVIDLVEINFDTTRAINAGYHNLDYDLENATPMSGFTLVADNYPLPWMLMYQITAYSRQPYHDRQLAMIMYRSFPNAYGSLNMSNYDGTIRRADLESVVRRDTVDNENKRLYRNVFTVGISSEFYLNVVTAIQQATSVNVQTVPIYGP